MGKNHLNRHSRRLLWLYFISFVGLHPTWAVGASEVVHSFDLGGPYYHTGSQAIEAYPHWDRAIVGPIPTVVGATKFGGLVAGVIQPALKIIAIISEDASAHSLLVAHADYDQVAANPKEKLPGQKTLLTRASTAEMFANKCLVGWNVGLNQLNIVAGEQAQNRTAFADKTANVALAWIPFVGLMETDRAKGKSLECPNMQGLDVPAFIVARADLLNETNPTVLAANRARLAEFVAKALGAWASAKKHPHEAAEHLIRSYREEDIEITEAQARAELESRCPPDLDGQRSAFRVPRGGVAPLAQTMDGFLDFMISSGTLDAAKRPSASSLIDPSILELIANTPALTALAKAEAALP